MIIDLLDINEISSLIEEMESSDILTRRVGEYKSYKVCNGAQEEYIKTSLKAKYPESHTTMTVGDISIGKRIIEKISKSYKEKPTRVLENDADTDAYAEIVDDNSWQIGLQDFDRDYNRQKYALLWVNRQEDKITLHSLKGFESFVIINQNTLELELVCLNYPDSSITTQDNSFALSDGAGQRFSESQDDTSAEVRIYVFWTNEQHATYKAKTSPNGDGKDVREVIHVPQDANPSSINPIGILPFAFISKSTSPDLPFINNLSDQSVAWNVHFSEYLTSASAQGFGQLVLSSPEGTENKEVHTGRTTAIQLILKEGSDIQPDAKYINANPNLAELNESLVTFAEGILGDYGISSGVLKNEGFNSGIERMIAMADIQDVISSNQSVYHHVEQKVFDIVRAYSPFMANIKTFAEQRISVIYPKPKVLISDKETLENIKVRRELGLITQVESLMILDPNLDEAKAQSKLDLINKEKTDSMDTMGINFNENTKTNKET